MKAVFGILSLVIVLAVIGMVAKKQQQVVSRTTVAPAALAAPDAKLPPTLPQQAKSLEDKVRADSARALQQGAQRIDAAER